MSNDFFTEEKKSTVNKWTQFKDLMKLFGKIYICTIKKHKISEKNWNAVTPLLPSIDACCVRCGYPFTITLEENDKLIARSKYPDEGGF